LWKWNTHNGTSTLSSPDLDPSDLWLFQKIKSALKFRRFKDNKDIPKKKKCDDGTESYSTTGVPKMFPTTAEWLG
jgi:hypothetical protein